MDDIHAARAMTFRGTAARTEHDDEQESGKTFLPGIAHSLIAQTQFNEWIRCPTAL